MTDQIVRLRINLEDIEPIIWRRIELPLANSLKTLHLYRATIMMRERDNQDENPVWGERRRA
jgi:hypothetical protein